MPTYDYTCSSCGHELEAFQNITDAPLADCPSCGGQALQRGVGGGQLLLRSSSKSQGQAAPSCCPCGKTQCS